MSYQMRNPEASLVALESREVFDRSVGFVFLRFIKTQKFALGAVLVAGLVTGAGSSFLFKPRYRADARVTIRNAPPVALNLRSAAALAGRMGVVSGGNGGITPEFVVALSESRLVLDPILNGGGLQNGAEPMTLAEYLLDEASLTPLQFLGAREEMRDRTEVDLEIRTGIIRISFWDYDPEVSRAVTAEIVAALNRQLTNLQRSSALSRRDYIARRSHDAGDSLAARERDLANFQAANRRLASSPWLRLEGERLGRRVTMAQDLFVSLSKQLDEAEIEVRSDIPELMVVESPVLPPKKFFPSRTVFGIAMAVLVLAIFTASRLAWPTFREVLSHA